MKISNSKIHRSAREKRFSYRSRMSFLLLILAFYFANGQDSICDKYSKALGISNKQLISAVVEGTVFGVVASGAPTKKYFDGTKPAGSTNYLTNAPALKALSESLVSFFGSALSCSDGTISPYTGPTMSRVHQPLGISSGEFNFFNQALLDVLAKAGVVDIDRVAVHITLNVLKDDIVSQNSICDRYSTALKLNNKDLVNTVVVQTFQKITTPDSPLLKYFNGVKPPGSLNFLNNNNSVALDGLVNGLTTWFGDALGCSDDTIPPYAGAPLRNIHKRMMISTEEFNYFNGAVVAVLRVAGVTRLDLQAVDGALNSTKADIVSF